MRKRILLALVITGLVVGTVLPTNVSLAAPSKASLDKINRELKEIQKKKKSQQQQMKKTEEQINVVQKEKKGLETQLMQIDLRRNDTQKKLDKLEQQMDDTKEKAANAQDQLDEAKDRVAKRDALLRTRVTSMYERGTISYLDVLLGSSDFGDFLTRMQALQLILEQDTRILEDNIRDKETIETKKKEIDHQLTVYAGMFDEAEDLKVELDKQYKQSMVVKAELEKKESALQEDFVQYGQELLSITKMESAKYAERVRAMSSSSTAYKGGKFALPVASGQFRFTSGFGVRKDPFTGRSAGHNGVDMAARKGTTIMAAADGIVIYAGYSNGYGNTVMIKHNAEFTTLYGHIREGGIKVSAGQSVSRGQKIAEVGSTGRSTGNHVHFTVYKNDVEVNPMPYLK
ncbi:murein hydrolase activator EnvC family protein [Brevibacillus porteri]|uniref:Metalloendopeptidase n=1 Tax=Brevibacillus porteri TaxID=2126350 RepID=A0ABX5FMQ5_9BACL|nr:M23 family metallopeptidase [Brevibacillus porteri]MED1801501.1 peptidoglycan DD-metalloendopeptidase family protein [Brevibacillus porteri]MED2133796.1 peptidoglycan DD-metalloendopeptidase family protein [Brevibacillus porteri]MED2748202.1 peptidoglycan DD-metalloendopeptidase family protein [Brevibacillus porteri]MED2815340.1 peptidoglycan DD-metalloendopeptidase family protein [Brevibacillus porteri]MED2894853.1 peptidoglycan DD-metalloendopeptidase family protein [Brevibacillus porteri